jgi:ATP/maltotriose-dependent transcriptional regulator MalT
MSSAWGYRYARTLRNQGIALDPLVASRVADCMKQEALTRREKDILGQIMLGLSNKSIASNLTVAVGTVKRASNKLAASIRQW